MNIGICTLGCKVNQYESQAMEAQLLARGHKLVPFDSVADAYLINTCSVTGVSDKKSRQMIRKARRQNPNGIVAVCGCYAQTHPEEAASLEADLVAGTLDRMAFLDLLEQAEAEKQRMIRIGNVWNARAFEVMPAGSLEGRTRAMLKIEDGCVNFCTYCIIPYARGRVRSLPIASAVEEALRLSEEGYQELVLTGIEISSYGVDLPGSSALIDLLEALSRAPIGTMRLRLGSLEPRTITEDFCKRAAALPALCPHFHLSLQSGCDTTLQRMGRKYDTDRFLQSIALLRTYFDHPAITTDLIVGFPGETEAEFQATLSFLEKCGFSSMHIFPYSKRPGTPAAKMPNQIPAAEKQARAHRASQIEARLGQAYLQSCVGRTLQVLFERSEGVRCHGHGENYVEVYVKGDSLRGQILPVLITEVEGNHLIGITKMND